MSAVKPTCFDTQNISAYRTAETYSLSNRGRQRKLSTSYHYRRGTLSPLHLAHKALKEEAKALSIGYVRLQSQGASALKESQAKATPLLEELDILSKYSSLFNPKRILARFSVGKLKEDKKLSFASEKKAKSSEKNSRLVGRSPAKSTIIKELLPGTKARKSSYLKRGDEKLTVSGIVKSFSPRRAPVYLDPAMLTFRN